MINNIFFAKLLLACMSFFAFSNGLMQIFDINKVISIIVGLVAAIGTYVLGNYYLVSTIDSPPHNQQQVGSRSNLFRYFSTSLWCFFGIVLVAIATVSMLQYFTYDTKVLFFGFGVGISVLLYIYYCEEVYKKRYLNFQKKNRERLRHHPEALRTPLDDMEKSDYIVFLLFISSILFANLFFYSFNHIDILVKRLLFYGFGSAISGSLTCYVKKSSSKIYSRIICISFLSILYFYLMLGVPIIRGWILSN